MIVIGSSGPIGWLGSGGGGSKADWEFCDRRMASPACIGRKLEATTAFGMTETLSGFRLARRVVFSLL